MKRIHLVLFLVSILFVGSQLFGALTSSVQVTLGSDHTSAVGLSTARDNVGYSINKTFSNGSGTTQVADLVYHGSRTLSPASNETLDFYGSLTDAFGNTLNFARIKSIAIEQTSASMTLTVGNAAAPLPIFSPATATVDVQPSGVLAVVFPLSGVAVTDTTADGLKIDNPGASTSTYKIHVIGSSI